MKAILSLVLTLVVLSMFFPTAYAKADLLVNNLLDAANQAITAVSAANVPRL